MTLYGGDDTLPSGPPSVHFFADRDEVNVHKNCLVQ